MLGHAQIEVVLLVLIALKDPIDRQGGMGRVEHTVGGRVRPGDLRQIHRVARPRPIDHGRHVVAAVGGHTPGLGGVQLRERLAGEPLVSRLQGGLIGLVLEHQLGGDDVVVPRHIRRLEENARHAVLGRVVGEVVVRLHEDPVTGAGRGERRQVGSHPEVTSVVGAVAPLGGRAIVLRIGGIAGVAGGGVQGALDIGAAVARGVCRRGWQGGEVCRRVDHPPLDLHLADSLGRQLAVRRAAIQIALRHQIDHRLDRQLKAVELVAVEVAVAGEVQPVAKTGGAVGAEVEVVVVDEGARRLGRVGDEAGLAKDLAPPFVGAQQVQKPGLSLVIVLRHPRHADLVTADRALRLVALDAVHGPGEVAQLVELVLHPLHLLRFGWDVAVGGGGAGA